MTRLGGSILALILLAAVAFGSMLTIGRSAAPQQLAAATVTIEEPPEQGSAALVVPVAGHPRAALRDSWGEARGGGTRGHRGLDILAAAGTPVLAASPGVVEKLFESRLGGTTLYQRSADGRWTYYYAHLSGYAPGIRAGLKVRAGQHLGYVGDTGDAGPGNHHLHFAVSRMKPGERWWQGEDVNPYPLLARTRPLG